MDSELAEDDRELIASLYLSGGCMAFAYALSRRTGWPIAVYESADGHLHHCAGRHPSGKVFDSRGLMDEADCFRRWGRADSRVVDKTEAEVARSYPQDESRIARADRHIQMLHPDLPGNSVEIEAANAFLADFDEVCRKHGFAVRSAYPNGVIVDRSHGDEVYSLRLVETGGGFVLDRAFAPTPGARP